MLDSVISFQVFNYWYNFSVVVTISTLLFVNCSNIVSNIVSNKLSNFCLLFILDILRIENLFERFGKKIWKEV